MGQRLTADVTPGASSVTYQWKQADAAEGAYTNIAGEAGSTYTIAEGMEGKFVKVEATATGAYAGTVESTPVEVRAAR